MQFGRICMAALAILSASAVAAGGPSGEIIVGKVSYTGIPAKPETINMAKQPECIKMYGKPPTTEKVVTGSGNALQNVVVYISAGATESSPPPATPVVFDQQRCHYTTHVLAFRAGQEVIISNSDPFSHNIHPLARINRDWNKLQLPATPPFTYSYESEEFIPVKCNIHPRMQAYFVVLKTSHFALDR